MKAAGRLALASSFVILCGLGACSSFGAAPDPSEGGVPQPDSGSDVLDASPPVPDAAPSLPDAAPPLGPFCRTVGPVTLCDEFDRTDVVGTLWTRSSSTVGSTLSIGAGDAGNELRALLPPGTSRGFVRLEKVAARAAGYAGLALDLQVDSAPSGPIQLADVYFGEAAVVTLVLSPPTTDSGVGNLQASVYELQFDKGALTRTVEHPLTEPFPAGSFHRVDLRLDVNAKALVVLLDGRKALDVTTSLPASAATQTPVTGLVGIVDSNALTLPTMARARNVVFDLR